MAAAAETGATGVAVHCNAASAARPLDPYEDNSINWAPGKVRRDYESAFSSAQWGSKLNQCGGHTLLSLVDGKTTVIPRLCDSWSCPVCGVRKAGWLKGQVTAAIPRYGLESFTTLTLQTDTCTPRESFGYVSAAWNVMRTDVVQDLGRFSFVKVVEATKRGYAHLHLLASWSIDEGEVSRRWRNATDTSWVVNVQTVYSNRAANYLAKYCVKEARDRAKLLGGSMRKSHIYSKSRDIQFDPFRGPGSEGEWLVYRKPWKAARAELGALAPIEMSRSAGVPGMTLRGDVPAQISAGLLARCSEQPSGLEVGREVSYEGH